jgi:hypothetical protein
MAVTIERISLMKDDLKTVVDWNGVLGMHVAKVNIEIEASAPAAEMPKSMLVALTSQAPDFGPTTLTVPKQIVQVPRSQKVPVQRKQNQILFATTLSLEELKVGVGSRAQRGVALVVRAGGSSDLMFRGPLTDENWVVRGNGVQPDKDPHKTTGDEALQRPDALTLFKAGGVELLVAEVVAPPTTACWVKKQGKTFRLLRSPADVFYYSGHGLSHAFRGGEGQPNCLGIETAADAHEFECWALASDVIDAWKNLSKPAVLILAGCSVLGIGSSSAKQDDGKEWAPLLKQFGGPLEALLGYGQEAPMDVGEPGQRNVGNSIGIEMAERLASGSTAFVQDWLKINAQRRARNAVAMDQQGFWHLEQSTREYFSHSGHIVGPTPISK